MSAALGRRAQIRQPGMQLTQLPVALHVHD